MSPDQARLKRLHRIEAIRETARRAAALESGRAEATRAHLSELAARTARLAEDYTAGPGDDDGAALLQRYRFAGGLRQIHDHAARDARIAAELADRRMAELALADRRRTAAADRAAAAVRSLAEKRRVPILDARRAAGTDLE